MAAPLRMQVHKVLDDADQARYEERKSRILALAAQRTKGAKGTARSRNKEEERKPLPIPVVRSEPNGLCQNQEFLLMVTEYDYDMNNAEYQDYCGGRGVMHVAGAPGSKLREFMADWSRTREEFLLEPGMQFAAELNGSRYRYTAAELATAWEIIRIGRAKLQDCWELFRNQEAGGPARTPGST